MPWKLFLEPLLNQDGGSSGGGGGNDDAGITVDGTTSEPDTNTSIDDSASSANASVTDQLETDGKVTFTPEQKAAIAQIISGRVNEVKKQYEGTEVYKQVVDMIGDIIGSKDINRISEQLKQLHAQHQARMMGMTPQGYNQYQAQMAQIQQQAQNTKKALVEAEFDKLRSNSKYVDADLYRDEIIDLATSSNLSVAQAYWAVAGENAVKKISASAASDAAHRTMNQITQNQTKRVEGGDAGGQKGGPRITPEIREAAARVGMDPEEYMAYQGIVSIEQARAMRQNQNQ